MLIGNPERIDESDVTLYLSSLEDPSLARPGACAFMLIGPSSRKWPAPGSPDYQSASYYAEKAEESERMLALVERRFPGFRGALPIQRARLAHHDRALSAEERGRGWRGRSKRMGQELMKRQAAATFLPGLYMCGESTVMGTGSPAVTISAISAADLILRSRGLPEYRNRPMPRQFRPRHPARTGRQQAAGRDLRGRGALPVVRGRPLLAVLPLADRRHGHHAQA